MKLTKDELMERGHSVAQSSKLDSMHVSSTPHFVIPRASRILRAYKGVMLAQMTDSTYAVGRALREGAEVGKLTPVFKTREQADLYFESKKEI